MWVWYNDQSIVDKKDFVSEKYVAKYLPRY